MNAFYKELFEYNHLVNQKLIQEFSAHSDKASEKSVKWINHILNAHEIWVNRIDCQQEPPSVWQVRSLGYLKDIDVSNFERTLIILEQVDLAKSIPYVTAVGKAYENSVKDILFHVINHSTYHRGQIASDFKQSGLEPLVTDYIAFKR